jgi:hypothetical protein
MTRFPAALFCYALTSESFVRIRDKRVDQFVRQEFAPRTLWPEPILQLNPANGPASALEPAGPGGISPSSTFSESGREAVSDGGRPEPCRLSRGAPNGGEGMWRESKAQTPTEKPAWRAEVGPSSPGALPASPAVFARCLAFLEAVHVKANRIDGWSPAGAERKSAGGIDCASTIAAESPLGLSCFRRERP